LIVLLAVPALQRNARNTSRKTDVSALLGAVTEYSNNNNGVLPSNGIIYTAGVGITFKAPASGGSATSVAKVGYFTGGVGAGLGQVQLNSSVTVGPAVLNAPNKDAVLIYIGDTCDSNDAGAAISSPHSFVAIYETESGNNAYAQQCQGS
jgi:hypothetical protein